MDRIITALNKSVSNILEVGKRVEVWQNPNPIIFAKLVGKEAVKVDEEGQLVEGVEDDYASGGGGGGRGVGFVVCRGGEWEVVRGRKAKSEDKLVEEEKKGGGGGQWARVEEVAGLGNESDRKVSGNA